MKDIERLKHMSASKFIKVAEKTGLDPVSEAPIYLMGKINQRVQVLTDPETSEEFDKLLKELAGNLLTTIRSTPKEEAKLEEAITYEMCGVIMKVFYEGYFHGLLDHDRIIN